MTPWNDDADAQWSRIAYHNRHKNEGVDLTDTCDICMKRAPEKLFNPPPVLTPPPPKEAAVSVNTTETPKKPGNPPEPPAVPKAYTREEEFSPEEVTDAVFFLSTVPPAVAPDPAIDAAMKAIFCFYKNKAGDRHLARGRNWDGTPVKQEPPKCPDWQKCRRAQYHWGDCELYDWSTSNYYGHSPRGNVGPSAPAASKPASATPLRKIGNARVSAKLTGESEGKTYLRFSRAVTHNGVAHNETCACDGEPGCAEVRLSEMAGQRSFHGDTTLTDSVLSGCTEETKQHYLNLVAYYLFRCKDGHRWVQRIVDSRLCPSPECRAGFHDMTRLDPAFFDKNVMVVAYRVARAATVVGKEK